MKMMMIAAVTSALLLAGVVSAQGEEVAARVRNSFVVHVRAPYEETTKLFSPIGERAWAGSDWNPHFLFPRPEHDEEGAVFTIEHEGHRSVWVNSVRDVERRHFQYVYFIADAMVTVIDVHFTPQGNETKVEVTYTRTALTPQANAHVRALGKLDEANGAEWQRQIDRYLKSREKR